MEREIKRVNLKDRLWLNRDATKTTDDRIATQPLN